MADVLVALLDEPGAAGRTRELVGGDTAAAEAVETAASHHPARAVPCSR
ncbi:hypothetical protein ACIRBZ_39625 [Streptomyces sp. NPDC094038]